MAKNDFQYGGRNSYALQCGTITTSVPPGNCTLQCGMWLWNRDNEFTKWQHPAMWHVALELWQCGRWLWDDMPLNSPQWNTRRNQVIAAVLYVSLNNRL